MMVGPKLQKGPEIPAKDHLVQVEPKSKLLPNQNLTEKDNEIIRFVMARDTFFIIKT